MVEAIFVLLYHIAYLIPLPQLGEFIFENVAISKILRIPTSYQGLNLT
jgi:hypothetical protein